MTDLSSFAARAATLPAALVEATPQATVAGARVLDAAVRTNLAQATGGDLRLSRVRSGRGAAVNTVVRLIGTGSRSRAAVIPSGPVMLIEEDTRAHRSPFQYGTGRSYSMARRRKAARRGVLFIPGIGFRASAQHPGTKGKRPVRRAFGSHADEAGRAGAAVFTRAVAAHMDVT